jgi:hypothetical protein
LSPSPILIAPKLDRWARSSFQQGKSSGPKIKNVFTKPFGNRQSQVTSSLLTCETCGADPCINPSFCRACREADARKAHGESPRYIEPSLWRRPSDNIPDNWQDMSIEALMAHFDRARRRHSAPQATVEALMYSLRSRGTKTLEEADTLRRLSNLSDQQVIEVGDRLLNPEIARPWTTEEIEVLFKVRVK